ncbi:hypothetical protein ASZ90_016589 [hydrocarbon metagenome]|uniref:Uncharacterized protein n=1 Tax=hydrocarbon metagenome TaxID=938273 RepID=A0A0W8EMM9_9ZZZZ
MDSSLTGYRRPGKMHPCTAFPAVQEPGEVYPCTNIPRYGTDR